MGCTILPLGIKTWSLPCKHPQGSAGLVLLLSPCLSPGFIHWKTGSVSLTNQLEPKPRCQSWFGC